MKSNKILVSFGIFTLLMGATLVIFPGLFYFILKLPDVAGTTLFMRLFGVLLFLNGIFFYGSRHTGDLNVIKSFYLGSVIADSTMGVITLRATLDGTVNYFGYGFAAAFFGICLVYAIAYIGVKRITSV